MPRVAGGEVRMDSEQQGEWGTTQSGGGRGRGAGQDPEQQQRGGGVGQDPERQQGAVVRGEGLYSEQWC